MSLNRKVATVARASTVLSFPNGLAVSSRRTLASLGSRGFLSGVRSSSVVGLNRQSHSLDCCRCSECGGIGAMSHRQSLVQMPYRTLFGRKQSGDASKSAGSDSGSPSADPTSSDDGSSAADTNSKDSQSQRSAAKSEGDADSDKEPAFDDIVEDDDDEDEMDDAEWLAIQQRVSQLELDLEKYKNALARSQADLINLEHMAKKDTENARNFAIKRFSTDVLGVADALSSAIKIFDNSEVLQNSEQSPELKQMIDGVKLTDKALQDCFHRNGIQKMDALGEQFNPNVHEALFQSPNADYDENHVFHVVVDGYTINDHVLRPAKVGVSSGPPPTEE